MSSSSWADVRAELVKTLRGFPSASDEATVRFAFARSPVAVRSEAGRIAVRVASGAVRDGWRVLALAVALPASSSGDGVVLLERRVRTWLRAEGRHYPRDVVLVELERRHLEPALLVRMLTLWARMHHDTGTTCELEADEPEPAAGELEPDRTSDGTLRSHGGVRIRT